MLFGVAAFRTAILPRWTGALFAVGVVSVALSASMPAAGDLTAVAVRDTALVAMGAAVMRPRHAAPSRQGAGRLA